MPVLFQDPLVRRVEGSQIMPPSAVIHHRQLGSIRSVFNFSSTFLFPCSLPAKKHNKLVNWAKNFEFQAKKIDVFSRVFFPFVFAMFNIWYWSYYLSKSHKQVFYKMETFSLLYSRLKLVKKGKSEVRRRVLLLC